jgi:hypothetical protein
MSALDEGQKLLPRILSIGDRLLMSDAEICHFVAEAGHPLLGLHKPCLGRAVLCISSDRQPHAPCSGRRNSDFA